MVMSFHFGQVVATPGAIMAMQKFDLRPVDLLTRHGSGDWGDLTDEDKETNDKAMVNGERLLSSYKVGPNGDRIWVITEADRSVTTILLPEDY